MSLYSRLDRLAADVARLDRQLTSVSNHPQSQRTSVEGGSIDFNDDDGNLMAIVGSQEDGGNTINVLAGPTPPTPVGFTIDVDHGKFIVHWSGDFDGDALAPSDWSRAEVHASQDPFFVPDRTTARGSIVSAAGGEVTIGVLKGPWTIKMLAWSQAGKMSAPSAPVDVEVPGYGDIVLEEIDAANTEIKNGNSILVNAQDTLGGKLDSAFGQLDGINDDLSDLGEAVAGAVASANGKNTVHFDTRKPKPEDEGVAGDTWFVGQVGRPNDVIEATNVTVNPSLETNATDWAAYSWTGTGARTQGQGAIGEWFYRLTATSATTGLRGRYHDVLTTVKSGQKWTLSIHVRPSRTMSLRPQGEFRGPSGVVGSPQYGNYFTCPAGEWTRIHLTITAVGDATTIRHQTYLHDATLQAGDTLDLDAEMIALGQLAPYFDGDTEDGPTDNDPHYRYASTGTSEKYLPATDGLSDKWNVTAQYRHDGTDWVQVELSHNVISSVDIGALTVGSAAIKEAVVERLFADVVMSRMSIADEFIGENAILTGAVTAPKITASEELWAKLAQFVTVYAEMVDADVFNGRVFRGSTFLTTNESSWSDRGMFLLDDEGNPRIQAPTDGSDFTVNAEIVAKSLTAAGRASFLAENNRLEPGAGLVLAAGVGDPPSPPVVSNHYKQITPPPLVDGESVSGLAYGDGLFWRAVDAGSGNNPLDRIEGIDRDGVIQRTIPLVNFWARNGLTVIGDELFALGIRDDRPANVRNQERWVRVYGLDGTYKRQWEYPNYGTGTYQPGIGSTPAGNVSIAQCWQDGKLSWRAFTPTGSLINTTTRDAPVKSDAVGIYGGTADFGATRTVFAKGFTPGTNRQFTVYGSNGNDYFPEQSWYSPGRGDVKGLAWDGEKFYSIDPAGVITEYGSLIMGDDSANWWATYRWVGSGGKTTRIAPPARFAWARRSRLRVSAPNLPQGVTTIEPSLAFKTTAPVRTEFRSPAWVAGATPAAVNYEVLPTSWQSGAAPGDINNFPNSTPSSVKASTGLFEVKGDGSGRWGPLTFNPDGTMSSSAVPAWVPITAFASGFSVQSWGFAPAYRVWPDGKVEWRGVVAGNFSGTGTQTPFVIPSAARPSQPVNAIAGCNIVNGGSEGHIRVEFSAADRPTQLTVYPAGKARTWFALDNITYYKN